MRFAELQGNAVGSIGHGQAVALQIVPAGLVENVLFRSSDGVSRITGSLAAQNLLFRVGVWFHGRLSISQSGTPICDR